jgi:mannose-6-phosphate isomerase-like protein (cupin superfamily)
MSKQQAITLNDSFKGLTFLANRTANTTAQESAGAFSLLSEYRDGGVYIAHYAGFSEWEQHPQGDEIVQVLEGETLLVILDGSIETKHPLHEGQLFVVPCAVWHRFESPKGVKVMTVTPQPTKHSIEMPNV